jgi:hypothetical protein
LTRILATLVVAALVSPAALAKTPIPAKPEGTGSEPTAGGGLMPGGTFIARFAVALLDVSFDQLRIYLFPKRVACNDILFADLPYVQVTVDTQGSPLIIGHPSLQNGRAFVQVDFHPASMNKYFAIQPGASITFTRVDPGRNGKWHGSLIVKRQRFEGHVFSYSGTFSALWCGKD